MFRVGDEVERFKDNGLPKEPMDTTGRPPIGHIGRISEMGWCEAGLWIELDNWPVCPFTGLDPEEFRKVQRRNITQWLETKAGDTTKWDKSVKRREKA